MSTIGRIVVKIESQHADLLAGMDAAAKGVHGFGDSLKELGAGLAEGLGIGAGIELAKASIEAVTDVVKESISTVKEWIGTSLESANATLRTAEALHIHADTLGGLQSAAKKAGVDHEQLTSALEKLNAKIGEAATKGGESAEVFKRLGLDAGKLASQGLDKSLAQISDALAAVKNPAEQAALVADLLGEKIGGKLVSTLTKGSAALNAITEHARHVGTAFGDIDAGKLAATQRTFDEIGEHFEGMKNQLTIALAPAILSIAQKIESILPSAETMRAAFESAFSAIINGGSAVVDVLSHFAGAVIDVASYIAHVDAQFNRIKASVIDTAVAIGEWIMGLPVVGELIQQQLNLVIGIGKVIIAAGKWVWDQIKAMVGAVDKLIAKLPGKHNNPLSGMLGGFAEGEEAAASKLDKIAESLKGSDLKGKVKDWLSGISANAQQAGKDITAGLGGGIGKATESATENAKKIEEVFKHLQETADTMGPAGKPKELIDLENLHASAAQLDRARQILADIAKTKITMEVDKSLEGMAKEISTFGMDASHKKLYDLEAMGANKEQLERAKQYISVLDKLEAKKKDQDEAKKLIEENLNTSPLQKYQSELQKINKLHDEGLINAQVYASAVGKANKDLQASFKDLTADRKIGAETRRFDFRGPHDHTTKANPLEQMAKTAEKQAKDVADSKFFLSEIYRFQQNANTTSDEVVEWAN